MPFPRKRKLGKKSAGGSSRRLYGLVRQARRSGPSHQQVTAVRARRAASAIQRMVRHAQALRRWAYSNTFESPPRKRGL